MQNSAETTFRPRGFIEGTPLPNAVRGDFKDLSAAGKLRVKDLIGARPKAFVAATLLNWLIIAAIAYSAVQLDHWLAYILAVILIGGRQGVFGYLMHDQTHYLGMKSKAGDVFANFFVAWPVFVSIESYGSIHLSHHQNYFTEKDPDFHRKNGLEWSFPMPWSRLLLLFAKDLLGLHTLGALLNKNSSKAVSVKRPAPLPKWVQLAYYAVISGAISYFGLWFEFFVFWLLPLLTVIQVRMRISAICEHRYNLLNPSIPDSTPIVKLSLVERLVFPDMNFGYHIYHHMHTGISWSNLPKVHEIFRDEGLVQDELIFPTQWSFLRYIQHGAKEVATASDPSLQLAEST